MTNDIIKLLNLEVFNLNEQNIKSIDITRQVEMIICYITLKNTTKCCPYCGGTDFSIKDYQIKKIVHSFSNDSPCIIIYKARRFKCKYCHSTFYEHNPFSNKYDRCSTYTRMMVLKKLKSHTRTFTNVAEDLFISVTEVINIFDSHISCNRLPLSKIVCFDEVYTSKKFYNKYAFVMVDPLKRKIIDIRSSRRKERLVQYFSSIPREERLKVEYTVIDMWESYKELSEIYFNNAIIAVDSFHVIKHLNDAMDSIRISIMKKYDKRTKSLLANDMYYYMLKKFHYFFTKNYDKIYDGPIKIQKMRTEWTKDYIRKYLLSIDEDLSYAYYLKEEYREFSLTARYDDCDDELDEIINKFLNSHLEEFRKFGKLISHWREQIKNSFIRVYGIRLSNGPIEGINSEIKTIMKGANGFRNFERFRNRTMYSINKNVSYKNIVK